MKQLIVIALFIVLTAFTTLVHASTITDVASFLLNFTNAGFQEPTIIFNETETTFDLSIQGKLVDHTIFSDDASFTEDFAFNWWRGNVTFSQTDGIINPDTVTAAISIYHQAGINRPHTGDQLKGAIYTLPATVLKQGDPQVTYGNTVNHPANHFDNYNGTFSVAGSNNNITGWTFTTKGAHSVVPEPSSFILFPIGVIVYVGCYSWRIRKKANINV